MHKVLTSREKGESALLRREFLRIMFATGAGTLGSFPPIQDSRANAAEPAAAQADPAWNWAAHFEEWRTSREFIFPWDRGLFHYPERVIFFQAGENLIKRASAVLPVVRPTGQRSGLKITPGEFYASINIRTRKPLDIKLVLKTRPDQNPYKPVEYPQVDGDCNTLVNLTHFQSDRVFYQYFYREGKDPFRPVSPMRAFKNPTSNDRPVIYTFGDDHKFDDYFVNANPLRPGVSAVDSGLEGEYFYEFLLRALDDPLWAESADVRMQQNCKLLKNTANFASAVAVMINAGTHPDLILEGGDAVGFQDYRLGRQGLDGQSLESAARALFERERKYWGILSPLVPIYEVIGNHDGAGLYSQRSQRTHPYARDARMRAWKQPNGWQGGSTEENYYAIPLAGGRVLIIVLDNVSYSGYDEDKSIFLRGPEYYRLGNEQTAWLEKALEESQASLKILAYHNVLGGWPRSAGGRSPGYYGRGPLYTRSDYERCNSEFQGTPGFVPISVNAVEQPKITQLALEHQVSLILNYHDHIDFGPNRVAAGGPGRVLSAMHSGTTNEIVEEAVWRRDPFWLHFYGSPQELKALSSPTIDRLSVSDGRLRVETLCAAWPSPLSNLLLLNPRVGSVLRRTDLNFA